MSREARRLSLAVLAAQLGKRTLAIGEALKAKFDGVTTRLNGGQLISVDDLETFESTLKEVRQRVGVMGPLTDTERLEVVKAMGLSKGQWFKCPNGHIYAIGDCGGAQETASCPSCNATIGGTNYRLTSNNQLAPEMDGATHAAWS